MTELADAGVKVVCLDLFVDVVNKLKEESKNKEIYAIQCDITNDEKTEAAFKWITDNLGGVDILVNNAGMLRNNGILDYDKSMKEVELNVNINYTAMIRCSRLAFKSMSTRDAYGYIININSVCGHTVSPVMAPGESSGVYNGTKYAITATAEVMRFELNSLKNLKVRVTNISPGVIMTNLFQNARMGDASIEKHLKSGPVLYPKHIADTVKYLLSTPYEVNIADIVIRATGAPL